MRKKGQYALYGICPYNINPPPDLTSPLCCFPQTHRKKPLFYVLKKYITKMMFLTNV